MSIFSNVLGQIKRIIFGYATPKCVGLDISATAIKMVELYPNSLKIAKYRLKPLAKNLVADGVINDIDKVSAIIRQEWNEFKSAYSDVAIAMPDNAIVRREVVAPLFENKYQLDEFIHKQLIKELANQDIDFDYAIKNLTKTSQEVAVVVAKKEKIEEYQAVIQMAGLRVAAIDIEPLAIQYLFEKLLARNLQPEQPVLLLDLGATRLRAWVFQQHKPISFNEISLNYHVQRSNLELLNALLADIAKLMQLVRSAVLVEHRSSLAENIIAYTIGGNSLLPGIQRHLNRRYFKQIHSCSELLSQENQHVPPEDLLRLITAMALATWGQQIA